MAKLTVTVRSGLPGHRESPSRDHTIELASPADLTRTNGGQVRLVLEGKTTEIDWAEIGPGEFSLVVEGKSYGAAVARSELSTERVPEPGCQSVLAVTVGTRVYEAGVRDPRLRRSGGAIAGAEGPRDVVAPMPGKIVKVLASEGDRVHEGQGLLVIEAMKMQNELRSPREGRVEKIHVCEGAGVETGAKLVRIG